MRNWGKLLLVILLAVSFSCGKKKKRKYSTTNKTSIGKTKKGNKTSLTDLRTFPESALIPIMGKKDNGKPRRFKLYDPQAEISQDGNTLVLRRVVREKGKNGKLKAKDGTYYICLFDTAKKQYTRVGENIEDIDNPSLSPDKKRVAFIYNKDQENSNGDIYVIDADGKNLEQITKTKQEEKFVTWSPNGKFLCYTRSSKKLILYNIASKKEKELGIVLSDGKAPIRISYPSFSSNSEMLAFALPKKFSKKTSSIVIGTFDIESKKLGYTTIREGDEVSPAWINSDKYIAYVFKDAETKNKDGEKVTTQTLNWAIRTGEKSGLLVKIKGQVDIGDKISYSQKKKWVCFSVRRGKYYQVFVLPLEGKPVS